MGDFKYEKFTVSEFLDKEFSFLREILYYRASIISHLQYKYRTYGNWYKKLLQSAHKKVHMHLYLEMCLIMHTMSGKLGDVSEGGIIYVEVTNT